MNKKSTQPLLSLIIPVRGTYGLLEKLLASFEQNCSDQVEVLVVHDSDETVPEDFEPKIAIRIIRSDTTGLGAARNVGLAHANGLYVHFCDADDDIDLKTLARLTSKLANLGADVGVTNYRRVRQGTVQTIYSLPMKLPCTITEYSEKKELSSFFCFCWNKICKADYLRKQSISFPAGEYEDVYWSIQVIAFAKSIYCSEEIFYTYKTIENSAVNRPGDSHLALLEQYQSAESIVASRIDSDEFVNAIQQKAIRHVFYVICATNRLGRGSRNLLFSRLLKKIKMDRDRSNIPQKFDEISMFNLLILRTESVTLLQLKRIIWMLAKSGRQNVKKYQYIVANRARKQIAEQNAKRLEN